MLADVAEGLLIPVDPLADRIEALQKARTLKDPVERIKG